MWVLFDVKSLSKLQLKMLAVMRWTEVLYNSNDVPLITDEMKSEAKPTEVPPGKTLKFFPLDAEVLVAISARKHATGEGCTFQTPPWAVSCDDIPAAAWASHNLLAHLYMPRLTADGNIDYFPSYLHQIEGRSTQTTPGRFIRLFWETVNATQENYMDDCYGALTDDMLRQWTEIPKVQTENDVQFATTPEDIEEVYTSGPPSCMTKPASYFGGVHPVRIYGAGDLAVAYLKKRRGKGITQRAMCWPAKKIYSRIYGTGPLERFLKSLGYVNGTFDGARLLKLHPTNRLKENFVLPYVDYHDFVVERRDHLMIFHKEVDHPLVEGMKITRTPRTQRNWWAAQSSTSGYVTPRAKCLNCALVLAHDDVTNGYTLCKCCREQLQRCPECSAWVDRDAPGWVRFTTPDYARNYKTWKKLITLGMTVGFCPDCAKRKKPDANIYKKDGYYLIKPRETTGAHAD